MKPVLLDCRPQGAWAQGHFEGAFDADLNRFLSTASDPGFDPAQGGRHPLPPVDRWTRQLGQWGITPETPVVVYDGVKGEMGACRAWWMLKAVGHGPVEVLDGGIESGRAQGWRWTEAPSAALYDAGYYPAQAWQWPTLDLKATEAFVANPAYLLIDVRCAERWRGEAEPFDPVAGRIPGSVNVFLGRNLDAAGRFRAAGELRALYEPLWAGRRPEQVAVHCGSGVSACVTLYALHRAGFPPAALYVGSFSEWCRSGRPIGRGPA